MQKKETQVLLINDTSSKLEVVFNQFRIATQDAFYESADQVVKSIVEPGDTDLIYARLYGMAAAYSIKARRLFTAGAVDANRSVFQSDMNNLRHPDYIVIRFRDGQHSSMKPLSENSTIDILNNNNFYNIQTKDVKGFDIFMDGMSDSGNGNRSGNWLMRDLWYNNRQSGSDTDWAKVTIVWIVFIFFVIVLVILIIALLGYIFRGGRKKNVDLGYRESSNSGYTYTTE